MSNITIIKGNLFNSKAQTLVNTVNTVGVMGAGVALEFRLRYPEMYKKYIELCKSGQFQIGKLWLYKASDRWILNFPTKEDWKDDSKIIFLEKGLSKFISTYKTKKITSIAFPILGARNGKIPIKESLEIMMKYLSKCEIPIEIYKYDSAAIDELYIELKRKLSLLDSEEIIKKTKLNKFHVEKLTSAFNNPKIHTITQLSRVDGFGIRSIEKLYEFVLMDKNSQNKG